MTEVRGQFARYCQKMYQQGLVHAMAGNVSLKLDTGDLLITPSGFCLEEVTPDNAVVLHPDSTWDAPEGLKPSSEWRIHRRIYEARPDIQAVVHAHPPKATALSIAHIALDQKLLAEVLLTLGEVPLLPYILPGSDELADAVHDAMKHHHAVILSNHGVFTTGSTLREAYFRMELVESLAEMVIYARQLGRVNELTPPQVREIFESTGQRPLNEAILT